MSITCECPECGKRLKAADSAAGKKAKCPDCGAAVPIPKPRVKKPAADDDEFDLQKLNIEAGIEGPIEEDQIACPMCGEMIRANASKCRYCGEDVSAPKKRKKGKRSRSGSGMPFTVIVVLCVECLFVLLNGGGIILQLVQQNFAGMTGSGVRMAIEISVLAGLFQQKASARASALALCFLGLVMMFVCGGILIFVGQQAQVMQQVPEDAKTIVTVVLGVQAALYLVEIGALLTGDAKAYFDQ